MQMIPSSLARIAALLAVVACGAAHAQGLIGSHLRLEAQVVAPATSPTINSTTDVSGGDVVRWIQYLQSRQPAPWVGDGEQSIPSGHRWQAGSMKTPPNTTVKWKTDSTWAATEPSGTANLTAVAWHMDPMLKIDFSQTEKSTDFTGTGDGFRVIPYKKNFYVVNHHADSGEASWNTWDRRRPLNCRTAKSGDSCPGFPSDKSGMSFSKTDGEALTAYSTWRTYTPHSSMDAINYETGELFVAVVEQATLEIWVVCTNLDTLKSCGGWSLGKASTSIGGEKHTNLEQFGSRYFVLDNTGKLSCFDIQLKATCGTTNYALGNIGGMHKVTSTMLDGKMFFVSPSKMWCHDPSTNAPCAGWNGVAGYDAGVSGGIIPIPDAVGAPKGVCSGSLEHCRTVGGTTFTLGSAAKTFLQDHRSWVPAVGWNTAKYVYSTNFNAVAGSKIYMPRASGNGLSCFDFSTDAVCPGFPMYTGKNDRAYSVRFDPTRPNCLLMLGDAAIAYQLHIDTLGACRDAGSATDPRTFTVKPADYYRCDGGSAFVSGWDAVRVSPTMEWGGMSGLSSIKVTLRDGNGTLLPASLNPNRTFETGKYILDISDVPFDQYPSLNITYQMMSSGNLYSSSGTVGVDVTWKGPPRQVCFHTKGPDPALCEAGSTLKVTTAVVTAASTALETLVADKVLWSGSGSDGYAAAAAVTSTRALAGDLSSGETRTFAVQGRYALKTFAGDLWSMGLDASLKLDVANLVKMSSSVTASKADLRTMYLTKNDGTGASGSISLAKLGWSDANADQRSVLNRGLSGVDDGKGSDRIAYLRGTDGTFRSRAGGPLGPVINSAPTVIPERAIAGLNEANHPGYGKFRSTVSRPGPMVIWGGNDGAIHAASIKIDGVTESWAIVPDTMLRQAARYSDTTIGQVRLNPYFVDAQPMVGHANTGTDAAPAWRTVAVVPFGRGARGLIAIDVTKTDVSTGSGVLFEYTNTSDPELADLGYIVSPPTSSEAIGSHQIVKMSDNRWAVLVGNGIGSNDGAGGNASSGTGRPVLYAFYLDGAAPRWRRYAVDSMTGTVGDASLSTSNGLSTPRPVDTDGDGRVDVVYAGDIKGNLWRFDLKSVTTATVSKLYAAGADRPIHTAPLAVRNGSSGACPTSQVNGCWQVIVGTGAYLSPLMGTTNATAQQLVSILDLGKGATVAESTLVSQDYSGASNAAGVEFRVADAASIDYIGGKRGWKMTLGAREHAVSPPQLKPNGQLRVTTVRPIVADSGGSSCLPARSWLFEANPLSGPPTADTFDFNNDGAVNEGDRVKLSDDVMRPALAMAISGAQFSTPSLILGPKVSSSTAFLAFPSLNIDTSKNTKGAAGQNSPATAAQTEPKKDGLAGTGDRKVLGRASWRLVR